MPLTWSEIWSEQSDQYVELLNRVELLDRQVSPATYINDVEPTDDNELDLAWAFKKGGDTQVPENSKTQWLNPETDKIENVFVKLADVSPFAQPLIGRQSVSPIEIIDSLFVTEELGAQANWTFTPSKNYESIHFIGQVRSTAAAASDTLIIRYNATATAVYQTMAHRVISPATFAQVSIVNTTGILGTIGLIPAAAGLTPKNVFASFKLDFYFAHLKAHCFGHFVSYVDDGGANEQVILTFGNSANSLVLSSIFTTPTGGSFAIGSWMIAYGINPVT